MAYGSVAYGATDTPTLKNSKMQSIRIRVRGLSSQAHTVDDIKPALPIVRNIP